MLEKFVEEVQFQAGLDRPTAEKIANIMVGFLQKNLSPSEFDTVRRKVLGSANWQNRPRTGYVGYTGYTNAIGIDPNALPDPQGENRNKR